MGGSGAGLSTRAAKRAAGANIPRRAALFHTSPGQVKGGGAAGRPCYPPARFRDIIPLPKQMSPMTGPAVCAGLPPDLPAASSFALLLRARDGDDVARNELCARYLPRLRRWAHGRLPVWARGDLDTEDIVQDTLMKSVRRLDAFTPDHEGAFCAYVCEALRNRLRDALRRAVRRPPGEAYSHDQPAPDPSPLEQAVGGQVLARYESALQRLRQSDRELVVAR